MPYREEFESQFVPTEFVNLDIFRIARAAEYVSHKLSSNRGEPNDICEIDRQS